MPPECLDTYVLTNKLQGAQLSHAELQGASLVGAQLQGAFFNLAQLQGASFDAAELPGASLEGAQLQGASFLAADLTGVSLAQLQGALFVRAKLQGAQLSHAGLQGASLDYTLLEGAFLDRTQLQGADLRSTFLSHSLISNAYVFLARVGLCDNARIIGHDAQPIIAVPLDLPPWANVGFRSFNLPFLHDKVGNTPSEISKFIEDSVAHIPEGPSILSSQGDFNTAAIARMHGGLFINPEIDDTAAIEELWRRCEQESAKIPQEEFDKKHAAFLSDLVCDASESRGAIAKGIIRNWISHDKDRRDFSAQLARGLLGDHGKVCAATKDLDESDVERLRAAELAGGTTAPAPAPPP